MPTILIIDDQPNRIIYIINGLKGAGYSVDVRKDVTSAIDYLMTPPGDLCAVLVDVIMPPGRYADREHQGGTRTGIFLYEEICSLKSLQNISQHPIPLAVLTQTNDAATLAALNIVQTKGRPKEEGHHCVWSKVGLEVADFIREFKEFLEAIKQLYGSE